MPGYLNCLNLIFLELSLFSNVIVLLFFLVKPKYFASPELAFDGRGYMYGILGFMVLNSLRLISTQIKCAAQKFPATKSGFLYTSLYIFGVIIRIIPWSILSRQHDSATKELLVVCTVLEAIPVLLLEITLLSYSSEIRVPEIVVLISLVFNVLLISWTASAIDNYNGRRIVEFIYVLLDSLSRALWFFAATFILQNALFPLNTGQVQVAFSVLIVVGYLLFSRGFWLLTSSKHRVWSSRVRAEYAPLLSPLLFCYVDLGRGNIGNSLFLFESAILFIRIEPLYPAICFGAGILKWVIECRSGPFCIIPERELAPLLKQTKTFNCQHCGEEQSRNASEWCAHCGKFLRIQTGDDSCHRIGLDVMKKEEDGKCRQPGATKETREGERSRSGSLDSAVSAASTPPAPGESRSKKRSPSYKALMDMGEPRSWTTAEVGQWLTGLGRAYKSYAEDFADSSIDGSILLELDDEDLLDLVSIHIHRKVIAINLNRLRRIQDYYEASNTSPPHFRGMSPPQPQSPRSCDKAY